MKKVEFTCPECGSHRLEEIMDGVSVVSEITHVGIDRGDDGIAVADLVYGKQTNEGGQVEHYQCEACGTMLQLANDLLADCPETLAQWFEEQEERLRRDEKHELLDQHLEANRELYELRRFARHVREYAVKSSPDYPGIEQTSPWEAFYAITCALEGTESANRSWHKLATCLREAFKMTPEEFVEAFAETDQIDPETLARLRKQLGIEEDA